MILQTTLESYPPAGKHARNLDAEQKDLYKKEVILKIFGIQEGFFLHVDSQS